MKNSVLVVGVAALFACANWLLFTRDYFDDDQLLEGALLVGVGLVFGLAVGRPWALALPLTWVLLVLLDQDSEREISTLGLVGFILLITYPLQGGGVAAGVLFRRRLASRGLGDR